MSTNVIYFIDHIYLFSKPYENYVKIAYNTAVFPGPGAGDQPQEFFTIGEIEFYLFGCWREADMKPH